jgi:hypothetical protein
MCFNKGSLLLSFFDIKIQNSNKSLVLTYHIHGASTVLSLGSVSLSAIIGAGGCSYIDDDDYAFFYVALLGATVCHQCSIPLITHMY